MSHSDRVTHSKSEQCTLERPLKGFAVAVRKVVEVDNDAQQLICSLLDTTSLAKTVARVQMESAVSVTCQSLTGALLFGSICMVT